jgi:hypothetical protein
MSVIDKTSMNSIDCLQQELQLGLLFYFLCSVIAIPDGILILKLRDKLEIRILRCFKNSPILEEKK